MDKTLIAHASKNLRLRNINLYEGSLKRFEALPESGEEFGQQTKLGVESHIIGDLNTDKVSSTFRVLVDLGVRVVTLKAQDQAEPVPVYQIEAVFQVDYELTALVEKPALEEFAKYNAVHNVWPFWRQYVFSLANQSGLPCPEIPLYTSLQSLENIGQETV